MASIWRRKKTTGTSKIFFLYDITLETCLYPEYETPPDHSSALSHLATPQSLQESVHRAKKVHLHPLCSQ